MMSRLVFIARAVKHSCLLTACQFVWVMWPYIVMSLIISTVVALNEQILSDVVELQVFPKLPQQKLL